MKNRLLQHICYNIPAIVCNLLIKNINFIRFAHRAGTGQKETSMELENAGGFSSADIQKEPP